MTISMQELSTRRYPFVTYRVKREALVRLGKARSRKGGDYFYSGSDYFYRMLKRSFISYRETHAVGELSHEVFSDQKFAYYLFRNSDKQRKNKLNPKEQQLSFTMKPSTLKVTRDIQLILHFDDLDFTFHLPTVFRCKLYL